MTQQPSGRGVPIPPLAKPAVRFSDGSGVHGQAEPPERTAETPGDGKSTMPEPDWTTVRRIEDENGSHIEPEYVEAWPNLWKLRWHAAVVSDAIGIRIRLHQNTTQPGLYGISYNAGNVATGSSASYTFRQMWLKLNGIEAGFAIAQRLRPNGGLAVGYIVRRFDDQTGDKFDDDGEPMFDAWSYDHHNTLEDARRELAQARAELPEDDWRIYALSEIGDADA